MVNRKKTGNVTRETEGRGVGGGGRGGGSEGTTRETGRQRDLGTVKEDEELLNGKSYKERS